MASRLNLARMLTTNQQRFEQICRVLSSDERPAGERLQQVSDLIRDVENYRFVPEEGLQLKTLLATGRLAAIEYLATSPTIPVDVEGTLRALAAVQNDTEPLGALSILRDSVERLESIPHESEAAFDDPRRILTVLLDTVWGYTFPQYFRLERQQRESEARSDE